MYVWSFVVILHICFLSGLFPASSRQVRTSDPVTSTGSGWGLVWMTFTCPITQCCSAFLVPHQTQSLTGPATNVSCLMESHVTSVDSMTRNPPMLLILHLEVCRYCALSNCIFKPKCVSPSSPLPHVSSHSLLTYCLNNCWQLRGQ